MSDQTTPNGIPASQLERRQHVVLQHNCTPTVFQVEHTLPYRDGDGHQMVGVTLSRVGGGEPRSEKWSPEHLVRLASEGEVVEARDAARRQQLLDDLLALRHVLDAAGVRASAYQGHPLHIHVVEGEVDRLADVLGLGVEPFGESAVAIDWTAPGGTDLGDRLQVRIWGRRAPVPQPEVESIALDPAAGAALAEKVQAEADTLPESEQEWLFTFGPDHGYPDRFVRIFGSYEGARERMFRVFGNRWSAQYDWRAFDRSGLQAMLTELPESEWPTPAGELCPDPWHEQRTEPTEPCPACGDKPPAEPKPCTACKHPDEHWHDLGCEHIDGYGQRCGCTHVPAGR